MMNRVSYGILLFVICAFSMSFILNGNSKNSSGNYKYLKKRLENSKRFTLEVIKAMPETEYKYKPTINVRSYRALASHVVYSLEWNIELMKGAPIKWAPEDEERYTKQELIAYANEQFDDLINFVKGAKERPKLTNQIIDVLNHNAHHRGQMTIYLRMKGITPPNYR